MRSKLFVEDLDSVDEIYRLVRDSARDELRSAKRYMETLWDIYQDFSDKDYPYQLAQDFHARFWEMYLTCVLISKSLNVCPKETTSEGPDISIKDASKTIYLEAIAPSEGSINNLDKVPDFTSRKATRVADNEITLRYCGAIADKFAKYRAYLEKGIVSSSDSYIIAINSCKIKQAIIDGTSEYDLPRIIKSVLPIGNKVVYISDLTGSEAPWSYQNRSKVYRSGGSAIETDLFLNPDYQGLSGILYSQKNLFNLPNQKGDEFSFIHNPSAMNPIAQEYFKFGVEYIITINSDHFSIDRKYWNKH